MSLKALEQDRYAGERLAATYASGCNLASGGPYVAEGTVVVNGGDLTCRPGDGDISRSARLAVEGAPGADVGTRQHSNG